MLLIPFDRAIDWQHPPWVTLLLVLVNLSCFVLWQAGDDERLAGALDYYVESGLLADELPHYRRLHGEPLDTPEDHQATPERLQLAGEMLMDEELQTAATAGRVMPRTSPDHASWQLRRASFEAKVAEVVFVQHSFRTAAPNLSSAFTHMFLHGDWGHLLGNMFFLVAVGFLVEMTLGSFTFLGAYLLGGLASAAFYWLFSEPSLVPGIGASGAIAGLMGIYTILYWTRPVRFFYFIFVYFDFVRLPAITLLPLWVGNELFQLMSDQDSNINYLAHLGGLLGGAVIGGGIRAFAPSFSLDRVQQQDHRAEVEKGLVEAAALCRRLEYHKARPLLRRLLALAPDNMELMTLLRETLRVDPSAEEYHSLSQKLLTLPGNDSRSRALVHHTFDDYLAHAKPKPRIDGDLACRLALRFAREGKTESAQMLAAWLMKRPAACAQLREVVAKLMEGTRNASDGDEVARLKGWQRQLDAGTGRD